MARLQRQFAPLQQMAAFASPLRNSAFDTMRKFSAITNLHKAIFPPTLGLNKVALLPEWPSFKLPPTFAVIDQLTRLHDAIVNNPEIEYLLIQDIELLSLSASDELVNALNQEEITGLIRDKEELLDKYLVPHLERLSLDHLWHGANDSISNTSNPDRLRHALISCRTLLEHMIDKRLSPNSSLQSDPNFAKEFEPYHLGKKKLEDIKVHDRKKRIRHFISKVEFNFLELTSKDIDLMCQSYKKLCNVHAVDVGLTEEQVRILKIKTGIMLWLLAHIDRKLNAGNPQAS